MSRLTRGVDSSRLAAMLEWQRVESSFIERTREAAAQEEREREAAGAEESLWEDGPRAYCRRSENE